VLLVLLVLCVLCILYVCTVCMYCILCTLCTVYFVYCVRMTRPIYACYVTARSNNDLRSEGRCIYSPIYIVKMLVLRGDVSCGEENRRRSLRGEYGKLNRRIYFKSASSIDSLQIDIYILQSAYIFNRHIFNRHIFNRHTSSIDISSIGISSGARCGCALCGV
jgi:hypothetical protein